MVLGSQFWILLFLAGLVLVTAPGCVSTPSWAPSLEGIVNLPANEAACSVAT